MDGLVADAIGLLPNIIGAAIVGGLTGAITIGLFLMIRWAGRAALGAMERIGMPPSLNRVVGYLVTITVVGSVAIIAVSMTFSALGVGRFADAVIYLIPPIWMLVGCLAMLYYVGAALWAIAFNSAARRSAPTGRS